MLDCENLIQETVGERQLREALDTKKAARACVKPWTGTWAESTEDITPLDASDIYRYEISKKEKYLKKLQEKHPALMADLKKNHSHDMFKQLEARLEQAFARRDAKKAAGVTEEIDATIILMPEGWREAAYDKFARTAWNNTDSRDDWLKKVSALEATAEKRWRTIGLSPRIKATGHFSMLDGMSIDEIVKKEYRLTILKKKPLTELQIRRRLRQDIKRTYELAGLHLGVVHKTKQNYITDYAVNKRAQQKAKNNEYLGKCSLVNTETGTSFTLLEASQRRKAGLRAETFAILKGIEKSAEADGLMWAALTLTSPPHFHANPAFGSSKWDGVSTPLDAHQWIAGQVAAVRKRLDALNILFAGVRSSEPHKDGCAHWHLVIYFKPEDQAAIQKEFAKRFSFSNKAMLFVIGDNSKSKFSSYALKYALKALNDEGSRADAWYGVWGIRKLQFFGTPSLTLWRELFKLKETPEDKLTASLWRAVKRGDAHEFIQRNGGLACKQKDRPVRARVIKDGFQLNGEDFSFPDMRVVIVWGKTQNEVFARKKYVPAKSVLLTQIGKKDSYTGIIQGTPQLQKSEGDEPPEKNKYPPDLYRQAQKIAAQQH